MRKLTFLIKAAAVKELEGIWEYTFRKWLKDQADRYHSLIISEIEYVADNKTVGKDISHVKKVYLVTQVKSHIIIK